jgi:hypothetical protein
MLLHHPELYVMRVHVVAPAVVITGALAALAGSSIGIRADSVPNVDAYFPAMLSGSVLASLYWMYVVIRQQPMLSFRSRTSGWLEQFGCVLCLLAMNAVPFVFSSFLVARVASAAPDLLPLVEPYSTESHLLTGALEGETAHANPILIAVIVVLAFDFTGLIAATRSMGFARVAVCVPLFLVFIGAIALLSASLSQDSATAALLCLSAYGACIALLCWDTIRSKVSCLTAFAAVGCVVGAPWTPMFYGLASASFIRSDDMAALLVAGVLIPLIASPVLQLCLNRFQAAPR